MLNFICDKCFVLNFADVGIDFAEASQVLCLLT
jgi:hypothetical protein